MVVFELGRFLLGLHPGYPTLVLLELLKKGFG